MTESNSIIRTKVLDPGLFWILEELEIASVVFKDLKKKKGWVWCWSPEIPADTGRLGQSVSSSETLPQKPTTPKRRPWCSEWADGDMKTTEKEPGCCIKKEKKRKRKKRKYLKLKKHAEAKHIWGYSKRHDVCEGSTRSCPVRGNVLTLTTTA